MIAGGKKLPELDALKMAWQAVNEGAAGVDMGRNIFQCDAPQAMIQAVRAVVHGDETPEKAYDLYLTINPYQRQVSHYASKNTAQVVCVAEFRALEGKTDELIAALHSLIKPTPAEPGCMRYELNQRVDDDRCITFIEKWKDRKAFDEHCKCRTSRISSTTCGRSSSRGSVVKIFRRDSRRVEALTNEHSSARD